MSMQGGIGTKKSSNGILHFQLRLSQHGIEIWEFCFVIIEKKTIKKEKGILEGYQKKTLALLIALYPTS